MSAQVDPLNSFPTYKTCIVTNVLCFSVNKFKTMAALFDPSPLQSIKNFRGAFRESFYEHANPKRANFNPYSSEGG